MPRLDPILHPGVFVFCSLPSMADLEGATPVATIVEREGLSVVVPEALAREREWPVLMRVAWIEFGLVSALDGVGLTATVSAALAAAGIPCNMVAGAYHDHVFVPVESAPSACALLAGLRPRMTNKP